MAQNAGVSAPQAPGGPQQRFQNHLNMMATALDLTAAQKEQVQSILSAARQSAQPIRQQLRQSHQSLVSAIKTGDNNQIDQVAANQGVLQGQMTAINGKAFAQVYALLTPQQKAKADQLHENMMGMFPHRLGR